MSRAFAYARVSTTGQETDNQVREIHDAGFSIEPHRINCDGKEEGLLTPPRQDGAGGRAGRHQA